MKISIKRTYLQHGTNGDVSVDIDLSLNCHSIEPPNLNNQHGISCIPEGTYEAIKHRSDHLGDVLWLQNVPNRDMIYFHAANDAIKELKGCIAPVTTLTGEGTGSSSRAKLLPIISLAYAEIDKGNKVYFHLYSANETVADNSALHQSRL